MKGSHSLMISHCQTLYGMVWRPFKIIIDGAQCSCTDGTALKPALVIGIGVNILVPNFNHVALQMAEI